LDQYESSGRAVKRRRLPQPSLPSLPKTQGKKDMRHRLMVLKHMKNQKSDIQGRIRSHLSQKRLVWDSSGNCECDMEISSREKDNGKHEQKLTLDATQELETCGERALGPETDLLHGRFSWEKKTYFCVPSEREKRKTSYLVRRRLLLQQMGHERHTRAVRREQEEDDDDETEGKKRRTRGTRGNPS
ncbi:hypothetical protein L249_0326, partial [Ophiocordyceps polyrhachis-furcata BCC 54312]